VAVCALIVSLLWADTRLARAAPDAGVVGDGTPASCTEAALNAALAGGGNVTFNCGGPATITLTSLKTITQNTSIDGGGVITISGGLTTGLFYAPAPASLALSNVTLHNAYTASSDGGALRAGGPLTVTSVVFTNNVAVGYCGAAIWTNNSLVIRESRFGSNSSTYGGGAICTGDLGTANVNIADSQFDFNQALDPSAGYGGAIRIGDGSRLTVTDTIFFGNLAHFGGALYASTNSAVTMAGLPASSVFASKLQLNGNSATEDGGAIYNKGAMTIDYAAITVNKTPTQSLLAGYGGAIFNAGALTLTNAIVSRNEGRFGGGLFVGNSEAAQAVIAHTSFIRNISGNLGGGLYANTLTTTIAISDSSFHRNTASGSGGGLARTNSKLRIYNTSFTSNAAIDGGAMLLQALPAGLFAGYVQVRSATFSGNTASSNHGGGIYNFSSGVELYSTTIVSNTNGVFSASSGNTRFRNSVLQNPGSLNCDGDGTASISDDARNFSTDSTCPLPISQTGPGLDPRLGLLVVDPIGGTSYHMPLSDSPLINAGFNCPPRDQINALRVGECDIGAVEFGGLIDRMRLPIVTR
jgi:predicted outer membrane repeat protein